MPLAITVPVSDEADGPPVNGEGDEVPVRVTPPKADAAMSNRLVMILRISCSLRHPCLIWRDIAQRQICFRRHSARSVVSSAGSNCVEGLSDIIGEERIRRKVRWFPEVEDSTRTAIIVIRDHIQIADVAADIASSGHHQS